MKPLVQFNGHLPKNKGNGILLACSINHFVIQPQQQIQHFTQNGKRKNIKPFTKRIEQRHTTKMPGSCLSKLYK